jgi:hypothetical protein
MIDALPRTHVSLFYLVAYLFPLSAGLLISPRATFHLLGSRAEHADRWWRLFGASLLALAVVVSVQMILRHRSALYANTVIVRLLFVALFSYLFGKTKNRAYLIILVVLGFGELWTLVALAMDVRHLLRIA